MKSLKNNTSKIIMRWIRIIHRDLGYLMVGVCFVYGISGFMLNHMNGKDPAYKTEEGTIQINQNLSSEEIPVAWEETNLPAIKKVLKVDDTYYRLMLTGGVAVYNTATGAVDYETYKKNTFIYWVNKLHYNKVKGWNIMGDLFAFSLIFFAISGLFMVKGKHGIRQRGKWYLIVGLLIPILYIFFS
ncbi:PepSY-associated TM helix domain-containing protein [Bacteroidales bacterium OttesenSCG-928-M11]|nr:PepSY-associated TM helix domain-containing protein [Bacteroidales bacterium OttesenSCG-928-M11]